MGSKRPFVRTPDERFQDLPDYNFEPNYLEVDGLRLHYIDEGPKDAAPVLMMHGEPSWSYLYRHMIPPVVAEGHRVIAPDLVGFGRSDKLVNQKDYSFQFHLDIMMKFVRQLELDDITLFCQDWGGLIGLRMVAESPQRFAGVIAANTGLPGRPAGASKNRGRLSRLEMLRIAAGFGSWFVFSQLVPDLQAGFVVQMGTQRKLSPEEVAAYDAPFPDRSFKAGARVFPRLVPTQLRENRKAWEVLSRFDKPFLTAFSDKDPITAPLNVMFRELIPGAKEQPHTTIKNAGHFLQEDASEELAEIINRFISSSK